MAEGESFVLAGGALAHRGLFPPWEVAAAAFGGSVTMDQVCFAIGRYFRDWHWVRRLREKRAMRTALGFVERHPNGYIIAFRYLYGLRIISPIAIGLTQIGWLRFFLLNTLSAIVWAVGFTWAGVLAGSAIERLLGRVNSALVILIIVLVLAGVSSALVHRVVARRTAQDDPAIES